MVGQNQRVPITSFSTIVRHSFELKENPLKGFSTGFGVATKKKIEKAAEDNKKERKKLVGQLQDPMSIKFAKGFTKQDSPDYFKLE